VDVEFIDPEIPPDIWDLVYGEEERGKLADLRELDLLKASLLIYSAKECIFKCLYPAVGRFFGFEAASAEIIPHEKIVRIRLKDDLAPGFGRGLAFNVSYAFMPDHILTTIII
jgi:4'-phosphopantetheinyl transferase EntD